MMLDCGKKRGQCDGMRRHLGLRTLGIELQNLQIVVCICDYQVQLFIEGE
jgi:hypothetical protein